MKALVTGATGFTGRVLARRLAQDGAQVRVIVRDASRWRPDGDQPAVEVVEGDIRDQQAVADAMRGIETVFHLAALYRVAGVPDQAYWDVHVTGTANLLEAARAAGVGRFVHCSTVGVHGHVDEPPADETYRVAPADEYQRSKLEGERLALRYQRETGFPVAVIRPTAIYGPGDTRLLKLFRLAAMRPRVDSRLGRHLLPHGSRRRPGGRLSARRRRRCRGRRSVHRGRRGGPDVEPAARADRRDGRLLRTHAAPARPAGPAARLDVRGDLPAVRPYPPLYRRRVDFFTKSRAFCIDKAKRVLGYRPKVALQEGLAGTAASYRALDLI